MLKNCYIFPDPEEDNKCRNASVLNVEILLIVEYWKVFARKVPVKKVFKVFKLRLIGNTAPTHPTTYKTVHMTPCTNDTNRPTV